MLDGELDDERLLLVGECLVELGAGCVELGVLERKFVEVGFGFESLSHKYVKSYQRTSDTMIK